MGIVIVCFMRRENDDQDLSGDDDTSRQDHTKSDLLPEHKAREDDVGDELDGTLA